MVDLEETLIHDLRTMARRGDSVGMMFQELRQRVGPNIVPILEYMRSAFFLTLAEAKPIAALSRTNERNMVDELQLEPLVMPAIEKHRQEWDR
jgi:hypothetical protein